MPRVRRRGPVVHTFSMCGGSMAAVPGMLSGARRLAVALALAVLLSCTPVRAGPDTVSLLRASSGTGNRTREIYPGLSGVSRMPRVVMFEVKHGAGLRLCYPSSVTGTHSLSRSDTRWDEVQGCGPRRLVSSYSASDLRSQPAGVPGHTPRWSRGRSAGGDQLCPGVQWLCASPTGRGWPPSRGIAP